MGIMFYSSLLKLKAAEELSSMAARIHYPSLIDLCVDSKGWGRSESNEADFEHRSCTIWVFPHIPAKCSLPLIPLSIFHARTSAWKIPGYHSPEKLSATSSRRNVRRATRPPNCVSETGGKTNDRTLSPLPRALVRAYGRFVRWFRDDTAIFIDDRFVSPVLVWPDVPTPNCVRSKTARQWQSHWSKLLGSISWILFQTH